MENIDLRILPLADLRPHERTDPRRVDPLTARLREEKLLRNPPIVAPLAYGDARFVVLDGANRVTALRALGLPHILAQVVDYGAVALHTWHHAITVYRAEELIAQLTAIPGLVCEETDLIHARAQLARREALAFVSADRQPDGGAPVAYVLAGGRTLRERT
ncbi:MAG TPA: ParB N-terminal domain-containing protein, partial [Roseiflexaceae bacterium]|nr:ParB N-terminal domain-containing protein [Roseiflexaceae bacterium]